MKLDQGLVHYHYGKGARKTTATFGMAVRAVGHDLRVFIIQFLKRNAKTGNPGFTYGEYKTLVDRMQIPVEQFGKTSFIKHTEIPVQEDKERSLAGFRRATEIITSGNYDLVILDEIVEAIDLGHLTVEEVVQLLKNRPSHVEVMITGHSRYEDLVAISDYVTEFSEVKHPFERGILAREGIEF